MKADMIYDAGPLPRETMSQAGLQPQHHSAQSIVELGW